MRQRAALSNKSDESTRPEKVVDAGHDRSAGLGQSREVGLIRVHDLVNRFILSDDEVPEFILQFPRLSSILGRVQ